MARGDLGPFYRELAALFEVPQQAPSELDFIDELAVDAHQAPLLGVNPDLARHFVKNLPLAGRRLEARIGLKISLIRPPLSPAYSKRNASGIIWRNRLHCSASFRWVCSNLCCSSGLCESLRMRSVSPRCWASVKGSPAMAIKRSSEPDLVSTTSLVSCLPSTSLTNRYFQRISVRSEMFSSLRITALTRSTGEDRASDWDSADAIRETKSKITPANIIRDCVMVTWSPLLETLLSVRTWGLWNNRTTSQQTTGQT